MEQKLKNANSVAGDIPSVANKVQADALQPVGEMNRYSELENGLKNFFGEDFDISDKFSQDLLLQHLKMNKEQNDKLAETLERDPRLAQLMLDVIGGKRNAHSAMARYFGNSFMTVDEDSPEFEEIMMADEERKNLIGCYFIEPRKNSYRCRIPPGWASTSFPWVEM